ncbi:MAG: EAL domain-containing protein [Lachnospiraceae bacterium]|nr:EAL domain-containing protein [Lachnospiraceae bacterium]
MMYRKVRGKFLTLLFLVLMQTLCSELEIQSGTLPHATVGRMIFSTACYILRPSIMYALLLIIIRNDSRKRKIIYGIPLIVTSVILIAGIFSSNNLVFSYSENNSFETGKLFPVTYLILIVYLALILILTFIKYDFKLGLNELFTIYTGILFVIVNIIGERVGFLKGNSDNITALAVLIYAIHFKTIEDQRERKILESTEKKTGLLNENACAAKLDELLKQADHDKYAAVFFDLERFGLINDKYGTEIGDRVMTDYAEVLRKMVRHDEILARQGGDRFIAVILQRNLDVFLAQIASTKIKFTEAGTDYDIDVSAHVGVYKIEQGDSKGESVISNAHSALNVGKAAGNFVTYMNPELREMLKDEKKFASDIPLGMANREFVAYYQPKVNSRTNSLCGAEALVRWIRNGELIPPGKFIPIMETKDMMCDMDFYMLRRVCEDISAWIEKGMVPPTISVNFSRRNLSNANLAADIDAVVQEYHVPKKMIEIEITETIDEFPISVLKGFVDDLHRLGYKVAVDDFGNGSSSLSLLREVTFDTLKIDKGFVDRAYAKDLAILSHMIKLAKAIGVETLAEGVEHKEQVDNLLSLGCEIIQGYYFDKPLPKESFERRIINRRYDIG